MSGPGPAGGLVGGAVGFVGIGNMGRRMAANLAAAGFPLIVRDSDADAQERFVAGHGGEPAASPQSFAEAGVVVTMLPDGSAVREAVADRPGRGLTRGRPTRAGPTRGRRTRLARQGLAVTFHI